MKLLLSTDYKDVSISLEDHGDIDELFESFSQILFAQGYSLGEIREGLERECEHIQETINSMRQCEIQSEYASSVVYTPTCQSRERK